MSITKKRIAFLPSQFKPESVDSLVRLGRDYDGGYLVDERCLVNADLLLGLGINDDWSFEEDFSTRSNIPVLAFDGSIGAHVFRKKALRRFINVRKFLSFVHWFKKYIAYKNFFSKKNKHYPLFLGIDNNKNYISLDTLFKSYVDAGKNNIFIKIDIEGSEYRLLEDILKYSDRINGLVIEFHDVDLNIDNIKSFIQSVGLNICHIHINNTCVFSSKNIPLVIEVTFTKYDTNPSDTVQLPHVLDMPNSSQYMEPEIKFF